MSTRSVASRAVVGVALALLGTVSAPPDEIDTSFLLIGGQLSVSVPVGPVGLGAMPSSAGPGTVGPTPIGDVTVTDDRGLLLRGFWRASVRSSDFTGAGATIPASAIGYGTPPAVVPGISLLISHRSVSDLTEDQVVQSVTAVVSIGRATATWNPTITVAVPAGAPAGTYTATLTHSVI